MKARAFRRSLLIFAHDTGVAAISFPLALYLQIGEKITRWSIQLIYTWILIFTLLTLGVFILMRLDTAIWRYTSIGDLGRIVQAVLINVSCFFLLLQQSNIAHFDALPPSFSVIQATILSILLILPRIGYKLLKNGTITAIFKYKNTEGKVPVLLIGAGDEAELFIRETTPKHRFPYMVVGIIDNRNSRTGRQIRGVPIYGGISQLEEVIEKLTIHGLRPQRIVITKHKLNIMTTRKLVQLADAIGIPVSRMPVLSMLESVHTNEQKMYLRPINMEDVLGRPQAILDRPSMQKLIEGKRVLITGAGGTIGSELVRQIVSLKPTCITLVEQSEYALYRIDLELAEIASNLHHTAMIGDIRDQARINEILKATKPEILFHAAALKHVPLMENNICDAVLTNAIGTRIIADAACFAAVKTVVVISTDKAVNPTNAMGATKKLAEYYCQARDLEGGTRFVTTRFGNVLGSTGSIVPLFQRQLERGGPLTVAHPDITRYFMTVREAVELVLQAASLENKRGGITVLDMGEPIKIVDLASRMIRLAGLTPGKDIQIVFTGLRPGDKLHEELFQMNETLKATKIPAIRHANPRITNRPLIQSAMKELEAAASSRQTMATIQILSRIVPEYKVSMLKAKMDHKAI
ncbi:polysaccharide biosynthesis protein CapD, putative [Candidatus Endolissoclinum faulkneri L5]|uniref:Polysaccharide biosynthesis protein CapD, putative n=1 Tax=Candidatus Endolissoclinum faulkneri L5 TaxID=1401328 RepID=V9TVZ1_9PROT|nr:nucleoside-diphosphate sugar epimerase/dehydratase [Candidatus Endolissoclinum faulkneri]AHC73873.1 polysaccharide biosynthesis protein CapD, putative [Candidatus Endolissoclinum faulkneri L5]